LNRGAGYFRQNKTTSDQIAFGNSTLKRFHGEGVEFLDLTEPRALDAMFRAFEKTDLVVVDCRAASSDTFFDYFDQIDLASGAILLDIQFDSRPDLPFFTQALCDCLELI
jgi:hypothetical protein